MKPLRLHIGLVHNLNDFMVEIEWNLESFREIWMNVVLAKIVALLYIYA